jgi:hypothetical protein
MGCEVDYAVIVLVLGFLFVVAPDSCDMLFGAMVCHWWMDHDCEFMVSLS